MSAKNALYSILLISIVGILFSGTLSYHELFSQGCSQSPFSVQCGETRIAGYPACVYGLIMYTIVFCISALGLKGLSKKISKKP